MTAAMVNFKLWANLFKAVITSFELELSKPEVGSSRNKTVGSETTSIPMLTLFLCPPEIPLTTSSPIKECLISSKPKSLRVVLTILCFSLFDKSLGSLVFALNKSVSFTERVLIITFCNEFCFFKNR